MLPLIAALLVIAQERQQSCGVTMRKEAAR
jgi:hypothetical protein